MNKEIESSTIHSFFLKERRERAAYELCNSKKRRTYVWKMEAYLDRKHMEDISEVVKCSEDVFSILISRGAPKQCYVMSINEDADGKIMPLEEAVKSTIYWGPVLVSCLHGHLAYFEGEPYNGPTRRFLLVKKD